MDNELWSAEECATASDLHKNGKTWNEIGKQFGISGNAAKKRVRRYHQSPPKLSSGNAFKEQVDTNEKTVEYTGDRILTLEAMLSACKVDTEEWAVDHWIANKWEVGRKAQIKHLSWDEGVMTGSESDEGAINVEPLFQIKIWLIRKIPIYIKPVIRSISLSGDHPKVYQHKPGNMKTALILPDPHFGFSRNIRTGELTPFHDRSAISLAIKMAQLIHPDQVIWLGDINDFSALSDKFIRQPEFYFTVQPALIETAYVLNQINQYTGHSVVLEGNHDKRFQTQMINHLLDAYDLHSADQLDQSAVLSVDNLLGLSRAGIEYKTGYPNAEVWLNDTLRCEHGSVARGGLGGTTRAMVEKENVSVIFGHIHKIEMTTKTVWGRTGHQNVMTYSPGCLCHVDGRVPGSQRGVQWQQGMVLVHYDETSFHLTPLVIQNNLFYNGKTVEPFDYSGDMKKQSGWTLW